MGGTTSRAYALQRPHGAGARGSRRSAVDRLLGRPLDVSHFLRIAIPLAAALRQVHEQGLIHKDIKPANILADPASGSVWLTGFGVASRALREAQIGLTHANRVTTMGQLAASIAHEVNQPLAGVIANAEACLRWLDRETPDLDAARRSVEWIADDGNRASEVIQRVRSLAKKTDFEKVPLDINHIVREIMTLVQREPTSHQASLRMELAPALSMILGDRVQLQQVIINLVMNGAEAMESVTDPPRELLIRSRLDETQQLLVAVTDSGVGISAENADRLFDPFFTTKSSGMGKGLSICRSIIEAHDGRLWGHDERALRRYVSVTLSINANTAS